MKVTITEKLRSDYPGESHELERRVMAKKLANSLARKSGQPLPEQQIKIGNKVFTLITRGAVKPTR